MKLLKKPKDTKYDKMSSHCTVMKKGIHSKRAKCFNILCHGQTVAKRSFYILYELSLQNVEQIILENDINFVFNWK